jgi:hypothetical protein
VHADCHSLFRVPQQLLSPYQDRRGSGKAIIATARKFLSIIFDTLKNGWVFEDFPAFKIAGKSIVWTIIIGVGSMTASYDYHIGVDYHKSYSHLVVQDSNGKTLRSGRVKNDRQSLGGFLERYRENSHAVVEATRNWMVMYDWLDDICDNVVLAHPLKVKAIADAKIKTDKIDATVLAHLLRADLVPEAWAPSDKARELRVALRERMFYVRLRTMTKNRIVTVFDRYPEQTAQLKKLGDLFGKAGRVQPAQVNVSEIERMQSTADSFEGLTAAPTSANLPGEWRRHGHRLGCYVAGTGGPGAEYCDRRGESTRCFCSDG